MRTIPTYHISESGIRLIKLLKTELPCLVRDNTVNPNECDIVAKESHKSNHVGKEGGEKL
jgi:hypothetical protein